MNRWRPRVSRCTDPSASTGGNDGAADIALSGTGPAKVGNSPRDHRTDGYGPSAATAGGGGPYGLGRAVDLPLPARAGARHGRVAGCVSAARSRSPPQRREFDLDAFDRMHRTNVRGTFVVSQSAARTLNRGGALINFSTSVLRLQQPGYAAYAATKGAVEAMTLILARELRGRDVTVNAVAPGPTATPLFLDGKDADTVDRLARMSPLERLGEPADIAETVAFLAGPARWVNGQVLYVNGGVA
ncbi:SDR family oxidoreductase [Nocardia sp. NPDC004568]|uniref:SDR family oxidoreductase n=1 Tax=Nocardia sp. NPDC004568 TaxID=3154551 RepID=UPI0033A28228